MYKTGIYLGMPHDEYRRIPALSCSGIKTLSVSPLTYWNDSYLNPDYKPKEDTAAMLKGTMRHKYILESESFFDDYYEVPDKSDYPDALSTMDDLKEFMRSNDIKGLSGSKGDLVARIKESFPDTQIWDEIVAAAASGGKSPVTKDELSDLKKAYDVILKSPEANDAFSGGIAELTVVWMDESTGVLLKARFDYIKPRSIIDYKTFSNPNSFPIDVAVSRAIMSGRYHLQALMYMAAFEAMEKLYKADEFTIGSASILEPIIKAGMPKFSFLFQTSDAPFEVRIKDFHRYDKGKGTENVYWIKARKELRGAVETYKTYFNTYETKPWYSLESIRSDIEDMELPWIMNAQ